MVLCTGRSIPQYGFHRAQSNLGKIQRGMGIHGGMPPSIFLWIEYHIDKKRTDGRFGLRIERLPQRIRRLEYCHAVPGKSALNIHGLASVGGGIVAAKIKV